MRDAEGTIERLLAGLRDAEPPTGINRRILEALDERAGRQASTPASLWRRPLGPAMAMLLACTVILIVAIMVHQHWHAPARSTSADVRQTARPLVLAQKAPLAPRRTASRLPAKRPHDVAAAGEAQAASFPAPPLPLTEQERSLLRLAHRRDADDLAILNPDVRAAMSAKATEQFQQFFAIDATEMRSQSE
jgi:hypothetical protein